VPRRELTVGVDLLFVGKPLHLVRKPQVVGPRSVPLSLRIRCGIRIRARYRVRDRSYIWFHTGYIAVSLFLRRVRETKATNLFSVPLTVLCFTSEPTRDDGVDPVALGYIAKLLTSRVLDEGGDIRHSAASVTREFIDRPGYVISVFNKHRRKKFHPHSAAHRRSASELTIRFPIAWIELEPSEFSSRHPLLRARYVDSFATNRIPTKVKHAVLFM